MRRPLFLAIVGVSIVVAAVSVGTALTGYLSLRTYSPKVPPATVVAAGPGAEVSPVEEWKNPFSPAQGMKIPSRLPAARGGGSVAKTNFVLVGTIASSLPSFRRAILWAEGMREPRAYRESEEVEPGAVLASVERDKVWLVRGSEREKLELLPVGSKARPASAPAAPRPAAAAVSPYPAPSTPGGPAPGSSAASVAPYSAPSSPEGGSPVPGSAAMEGEESARRVPGRIRRPPAAQPPAVGASPGAAQTEDDEERPRRRRRSGPASPPPTPGVPTL